MIKGAQKQMIVVRTEDSLYFDEAYFVLRREIGEKSASRRDIITEANRILEESGETSCRRTGMKKRRGAVWFLLGILCGCGIALLLWWLLL